MSISNQTKRNVTLERATSNREKLQHLLHLPTYNLFLSAQRGSIVDGWRADPAVCKKIAKDLNNLINREFHSSFKQSLLDNLRDVYQFHRNLVLAANGAEYLIHMINEPYQCEPFFSMFGHAPIPLPPLIEAPLPTPAMIANHVTLYNHDEIIDRERERWPSVAKWLSVKLMDDRPPESITCAIHYVQKTRCPATCRRRWEVGFTELELDRLAQYLEAHRADQKAYRETKRQRL